MKTITVYALTSNYPQDEYDEGSNGTYVEAIYESYEDAIDAADIRNYELRKYKCNNAEKNYYNVIEKQFVVSKRDSKKIKQLQSKV